MSLSFVHETRPQRVRLGAGRARAHLTEELDALGAARVMVLASPSSTSAAEAIVPVDPVLTWGDARQHVPEEDAARARSAAGDVGADVLVAVGGGSAIGLAKAIALTSRLPIVAVPTTYAGSEGTDIWGITAGGTKTTGADAAVLPVAVIYDSDLTLDLPAELSTTSGLNALAHCVDALWAPRTDPIAVALCLDGARTLAECLPVIARDPQDRDARDLAQVGCYLSARGFASTGSGLHHTLCHILGGTFGLPHAPTHAVVLPYVTALNTPAVPDLAARLATALGALVPDGDDPAAAAVAVLTDLRSRLGAPTSLAGLGLPHESLDDAADRTVAAMAAKTNPVPLTREIVATLLEAAWSGTDPAALLDVGRSGTRDRGTEVR